MRRLARVLRSLILIVLATIGGMKVLEWALLYLYEATYVRGLPPS